MLSPTEAARLTKAGYRLIGSHSAIKLCLWTKRRLLGGSACYKSRFYGIQSHRCIQMTPALQFCDHQCLHCWRFTEITRTMWSCAIDEPMEIVERAIEEQRHVLNGYPGNPRADLLAWREAQQPAHFAISLAGEPMLYPRLPELIKAIADREMTSFLVTNGQHPEAIKVLSDEGALPTQLYVSLHAWDEASYQQLCAPLRSGGWRRLLATLELLRSLRCRRVLRLTLIRGLNMTPENFASLIALAQPDYIETKSYMALGSSRQRLGVEAMPSFGDVLAFSKRLAKATSYLISDFDEQSRAALLARDEEAASQRFVLTPQREKLS